MPEPNRRQFIQKAVLTAGAAAASQAKAQRSPNDQVNLAVVGIHGRGQTHYNTFGSIPGVRIAYLVDIDERLFPEAVAKSKKSTATGRRRTSTFGRS